MFQLFTRRGIIPAHISEDENVPRPFEHFYCTSACAHTMISFDNTCVPLAITTFFLLSAGLIVVATNASGIKGRIPNIIVMLGGGVRL